MIKHVLADGRILDSIDGFRIPYEEATETAYRLLAGFLEGGGRVGRDRQKTRHTAHTAAQETTPAL
nr:hypothetical protein [uncultured Schaedlerella sp.]